MGRKTRNAAGWFLLQLFLATLLSGCTFENNIEEYRKKRGASSNNVFTSISAFASWLSTRPANTAANPYSIALNISDLGGDFDTAGSLGYVLYTNDTKYVSIDLSGSTFTVIGEGAFVFCSSLTGVTMPNSVTDIGTQAFSYCPSLTSVTIPNSVAEIYGSAFSGCGSLTVINVDSGNTVYSSIDGILYSKDKTILVTYPGGKTGAFSIPNSVTGIEVMAFYGCTSLTGVTIPNSVTWIGSMAFGYCTSLAAINVDSSNTAYSSVGGVLYDKNQITLIQYPAGKTAVSFAIPNSVADIYGSAFSYCSSLTSITIPNSVIDIGGSAFFACTSLVSVTIPYSVISIHNHAFNFCINLASVTFEGPIPSFNFDISHYYKNSLQTVFLGDLRDKFYADDPDNGTPGTYITTAPVDDSSTWTRTN
jgi:hypothetical protein